MGWIIDIPEISDQGHSISSTLRRGKRKWKIFFRCRSIPLTNRLEAFIALAALPAMVHGDRTIHVQGTVDPFFLANLERLYAKFSGKNRSQPIVIMGAELAAPVPKEHAGVGAFFSMGVDSWHSLLAHQKEITDLIFIHGYDIPLNQERYLNRAIELAENAIHTYNKRLLVVETNARAFITGQLSWRDGQSAVAAAAGYLLSDLLQRIYIPSSYSYEDLEQNWSAAIIEPYWSGSSLEFVYDGLDKNRIQKTQRLVQEARPLHSLRVCYYFPEDKLGCGRCPKCLVNMVNLRACEAPDLDEMFEQPLSLKRISGWSLVEESDISFIEESLEYLQACDRDTELQNALERLLAHPKWINWFIHKADDLRWLVKPPKIFRL